MLLVLYMCCTLFIRLLISKSWNLAAMFECMVKHFCPGHFYSLPFYIILHYVLAIPSLHNHVCKRICIFLIEHMYAHLSNMHTWSSSLDAVHGCIVHNYVMLTYIMILHTLE